MSLVFVRRNQIKTRKKQSRKAADQEHTICLAQHSGTVMKEGLFCTLFLSLLQMARLDSNQTCGRGRVMTCNMSPCQPQLTEHISLGPAPSESLV